MKFIKIILSILIIFSTISIKAQSNEKPEFLLKQGGKLIFIRHANAPGTGDPDNFNIKDCLTQRNLSDYGIEQSKKLGIFFSNNKIEIGSVLSSEWCRCKDTSFYAFKNFKSKTFLNSFYSEEHKQNKIKQINDLKKYIETWDGEKNLILVTHFVVISEILNISSLPAQIIITNKKFKILGKISIE